MEQYPKEMMTANENNRKRFDKDRSIWILRQINEEYPWIYRKLSGKISSLERDEIKCRMSWSQGEKGSSVVPTAHCFSLN